MSVKNCVAFIIIYHVCQALGFNETIKCGYPQKVLDDCFEDLPQDLKEFMFKSSIPINEKEITSKCFVFQKGIDCFDQYSKQCLYSDKLQLYQNNVSGAKNFISKLCNDQKFKKDYLRHKDCLVFIEDDWKKCTRKFQNLIGEELQNPLKDNMSSTYMHFCWYAYESCIYNSARYKCQRNSTNFVKMLARLLTDERHFRYCRRYEDLICSAGRSLPIAKLYSTLFGIYFLYKNLFNIFNVY